MPMPARTAPRYEDLTETTGIPVSAEGAAMMYTRYVTAAGLAAGRRVLELGCGSGQGFELMTARGARLVGGDYSSALLRGARAHYGNRIPLARLSADRLPFRDRTFDVVLLFEASYYVPDMESAFDEIARVLAPGGTAMFVNANPERPDFIRSPFSVRYHAADDFRRALQDRGFEVTLEGAFPVEPPETGAVPRLKALAVRLARGLLTAFGLVPKTLRGRARLKRLIFGRQVGLPAALPPDFAPVERRVALEAGPVRGYKVLYVTARSRGTAQGA